MSDHPESVSALSWRQRLQAWLRAAAPPPAGRVRFALHDDALVPVTLARCLAAWPGRVAVVVADGQRADMALAGLRAYLPILGDRRPLVLVPDVEAGPRGQWQPENEAARCAALEAACRGDDAIFVVTAQGLLSPTLAPKAFAAQVFSLRVGEDGWSPERLAERLVQLDYDNEFEVHSPGEFARRGGILDIFSPLHEAPVRLEFFGDQIESMRSFVPDTQRSFGSLDEIRIAPRGAIVAEPAAGEAAAFLSYLGPTVPLLVCSPEEIAEHLQRFGDAEQSAAWAAALGAARHAVALQTDPAGSPLGPDEVVLTAGGMSLDGEIGEAPADLGDSAGQWRWQQLRDSLEHWQSQGHSLVACCVGEGEAKRFQEMLDGDPAAGRYGVVVDLVPIESGVLLSEAGVVLLSEHELFGRRPDVRRRRRAAYRHDLALQDGTDLDEGTYAVHAAQGICLYHGIRHIEVSGQVQEVLDLEFDEEARLYVPLEQAFLVSRYVGGTKAVPRLSRLGGSSWRSARAGAEAAATDLAADLLRLEARRRNAAGIAFQPVPDWERSFAEAFPYTETEDQTQSIRDVLADMAKDEPMDRLLCGDVGYGKTEVAMRAAFRAVLNGRQVAVLVPTTVLAQQHYVTFRERLAAYPVVIEVISRFRTRGEQQRLLERLAEGHIDVLIGTHRLLQSDVRFANLGLVIVDEEQRFGVRHKQRLKELRASVDILTMTATPIPRTLYFSLAGLRHLSTIMTAPSERLPVTTVISPYDRDLIRQVVMRELERQGQVFFLHNRVQSIDRAALALRQLVPEARLAVAHGQMSPAALSAVMTRFLAGEVDVLVCTTIIESGIDIPNANTIIIDRADRFGLAELYQLRGRVGRYHRQAYAYLLLPPMGSLPTNARQRLQAIRRYTHLGAGFKLALRDLEIRGAGNILGTEQSGHIAAVGFDLYCKLLQEAVARLEQQPMPSRQPVPVEMETLSFALQDSRGRTVAAIPAAYVQDDATRIACYRRLAELTDEDAVDALAAEWRDRFGPLPTCVEAMLDLARVQVLARQAGVHRVVVRGRRVFMESERGLWRSSRGALPELQAADGRGQLRELQGLLRARRAA
ncbi:MAG: transcription-repair coupling factor [Lentisphaerae bacterium]|nr:transcription-repair coupling factor [Lentisphaerota bacterium]